MTRGKITQARLALARQKERLEEDRSFKVSSLLIPFMAVAVLSLYTSFETAIRLYGVAQPLEHNSEPTGAYDVWLSIGSRQDQLIISSINGETFSWPLAGPTTAEIKPFVEFLHKSARHIVEHTILKGQFRAEDSLVALSVDQRLTYHHIRPVIYALADAGFSKYGFETRILR